MIAYFPALYPDELIYSWFCRYYVHSGCLNHKAALQELFCKRSDNPSKEFIGNLRPNVKEQLDRMYSLDKLVLNHTMYPQYARFIPAEQKKNALYRLCHETCDIHHLFSVLPRTEGEQYLRFCPMCVKEDRATYGETYWHRKHQIRTMTACTKHRCKLVESEVLLKSEQTYTFSPADNYVFEAETELAEDDLEIRYAAYLESVFDAPMKLECNIPICAVLYDSMSRTEYMKSSGRSRYTKKFADDLNVYFRNMGLFNAASFYQIQRVLLGDRFDFAAVCQIAFFLGMKSDALIDPSLTDEQIRKEKDSHYMKDKIPIDWSAYDAEMAPILEQVAQAIYNGTASEIGRPERVSERILYRELNLQGHQLENMPQCKAIFEQYTESYAESWARKIVWAYQKLKDENTTQIFWSDIRKLSGVKKKNIQSVLPYLLQHTDIETISQILTCIDKYK